MSLSPPMDLQSRKMLPTWEITSYRSDQWRLALVVQRNPFRRMMWDKVRDDAVRVRYWNFMIVVRFGYRRRIWWHFVDRANGAIR